MADTEDSEKKEKPREMVSVKTKDGYQSYPLKPTMLERAGEALSFGSWGSRPELNAVRKRRLKYNDTDSSAD